MVLVVFNSVSVADTAAAMEQQPIDYSDIDSNPDICVYEKQQQKHVRWLKNTPRYLAVQAEIGRLKLKALEAPKQSKPRQRQVKQLLPPRYTAGQQRNTSVTKSHLAQKTAAATAKPRRRAATVAPSFSAEDDTTWQDVLLHIDTDAVVSV